MTYPAKPLPYRRITPPSLLSIRALSALTRITMPELVRIRIAQGIPNARGKKSAKGPIYALSDFPIYIRRLVQAEYEAAARSRGRCIVISTVIMPDPAMGNGNSPL